MTLIKNLFWPLVLFTLSCPTFAYRQVVIIGGGPTPIESQASIEINTKWIIDVIKKTKSGTISHILYTDGNNPGLDVHKLQPATNKMESLQALARVYGKQKQNNYRYYSSRLAKSVSPSDKKNVTDTLQKVFSRLKSGDELFLIYQGHGGHNKDDTKGNFLRLWGDTKMTVTELESLMAEATPESTIRFIFPQCFSGAFARLIYEDANFTNGLAKGKRCGFLAQNEYQGSEGCTASVETDTYRDYSSYFFSAINGKSISGQPLDDTLDLNHDNKITLREAHIYSLANAYSVDYSRSTSEDYLEQWQPWYFSWLPFTTETDGVYKKIIQRIAARFNIHGNDKDIISGAANQLKVSKERIKENKSKQNKLTQSIKKLQVNIQKELIVTWPQLKTPYTSEYRKIILQDINKIQQAILKHPDYISLATKQESSETVALNISESIREVTQMRKIFRMFKMGQILNQFNRYATENEKTEYKQLLDCEDSTL